MFLGIAVLVAGSILDRGAPSYHGSLLDPPLPERDFELVSADGPVRLSELRGRHVAIFFGYTFCPDVCPMTLAKLASARAELGDRGKGLAIVLVTVDPERDTPERLAEYTRAFGDDVLGLTGSPEDIAAVASSFGIFYERREGDTEGGYLVDHSATITVLDREGRPRMLWAPQLGVQELASDMRSLLRE